MRHLSREELEAGLAVIRQAPADGGTLDLIVRRPAAGERETPESGELDAGSGLVGDSWRRRSGAGADADTQLTVMNSRAIALIAQEKERWPLAGDQLYVDLDLAAANLPPGTTLAIGGAVIRVSEEPHTGCAKFVARFGVDAMKFVNSPVGRQLNLRGINARVVQPGRIQIGDIVRKVAT